MELLDRYLQAVRKYLPWKRQDDIVAELKANLESQLEEKESELGRPLTKDEAEQWLKQIGAPMQMAARYQPLQYLIGPAVFPTYWYVLRMALMWALVIYTIVSAVLAATHAPESAGVIAAAFASTFSHIPGVLLSVAAWVTLVFAILEFTAARHPEKLPAFAAQAMSWSPGALPPLERRVAAGKPRRSYAHAVAEVIFGWIFLVWLLLVPHYPYLLIGPGVVFLEKSPFQLAPVWWTFYWWAVAINVVQLAWHCADLLRGSWNESRPAQHILLKAVGLIPLAIVLNAPENALVLLRHPAVDGARYSATLHTINHGIHTGFLVIAVIIVLQLIWDAAKMGVEAYRQRVAR
jgi:hypothetical protein